MNNPKRKLGEVIAILLLMLLSVVPRLNIAAPPHATLGRCMGDPRAFGPELQGFVVDIVDIETLSISRLLW